MTSTASTPAELLRAEVHRDGARPLLTYYDDATGERVELSATTFDNWVAKTAGFLTDGLGVEPGDRVGVLLPPHWQTLAWACACWSVGACVVPVPGPDVQVVVTGPDTLDAATGLGAADVVAMALRPLGGRFTSALPDGVVDYAVEVPSYPDRFVPIFRPEPDEPAIERDGVVHTLSGLVDHARDRAGHLSVPVGARLLTVTGDLAAALVDALLVPLVVGGSAVLVRREDVSARKARIDSERITTVVDPIAGETG